METTTLMTLCVPDPTARSPRNTRFPVMKAVKTLPRARKLMASTAPEESVNAMSSPSRTLRDRPSGWVLICPTTTHRALLADDNGLLFGEGSDRLLLNIEVRLDKFGRDERHPLVERDVGEAIAAEHLQEAHRLLTSVLDVVAHRKRHVTHVACL